MNKVIQLKWNLLTGLVIIGINLYWIWDNLYLLYLYHSTGIYFYSMYPDWVLLFNSILGAIGILIGVGVIRLKFKIKVGIVIDLLILMAGVILKFISML